MDRDFDWDNRETWPAVFRLFQFVFVWGLRGAQYFWDSIDEQVFDNKGRCKTSAVLRAFRSIDPTVLVDEGECRGSVSGNAHTVLHGRCTERVFNYLQLRYRVLCMASRILQYPGANPTEREAFNIIFNGYHIYT